MSSAAGRKVAGMLLGLVAAQADVPFAQAQETGGLTEHFYEIPAQPLGFALARFARVSRINIVYETAFTANRRSTAIRGRYPAPTALRILLQGTGLRARFTGAMSAIVYESNGVSGTSIAGNSVGDPPSLQLDMAEVRAPVLIGQRDPRAFADYAHRAQLEIRQMLESDHRNRHFRVRIAIRVDPRGRIERVELIGRQATGTDLQTLPARLAGRYLSRPPPEGLQQPLRFDIHADRIADRR